MDTDVKVLVAEHIESEPNATMPETQNITDSNDTMSALDETKDTLITKDNTTVSEETSVKESEDKKNGSIEVDANDEKEDLKDEKEELKDKKEEPKDEYTTPELEKYWKAVKENPTDFTGWTYLLQYVEQEHNLDAAREAYDAFLARYPYCYGYWKKYTDMEKKHDNLDEAEEAFERGVKAIPLSIDLWIHYINFLGVKYELSKSTLDMKKRQLFDRAITAAGTDFRSDKLWEMYITWESDNGNLRNVCTLYDRVLKIPTQLYSHQFECFSKFVKEHHAKKLLSLDEFLQIRSEIVKPTIEGHTGDGLDDGPPGDEAPPGEELPPGEEVPPGMEDTVKGKETAKVDEYNLEDPELPAIREKIIQKRSEIHQHTESEVSKRWNFEDRVRRPYFHVKPLEKAQLRNWREYLDFEIGQGSHERVVVLFERCLIACALYEEFWLKYADYMIGHSFDGVRNVFRRACEVHLPKKPSIHLAWAAFEEKQGKYDSTVQVFDKIDREVPGLIMICLRRISVERRSGNFDKTDELYQKYVDQASDKEETAFFVIKYARYLAKVLNNQDKAKEVLEAALKKDPSNAKLLLQLIDLGYNQGKLNEMEMLSYFDRGIKTNIAIEHRVAFSQRKMEFLEDFGSNISRLLQTYEDHQKLLKELQSKKRKATGDGNGDTKKPKTGPAPTAVCAAPSGVCVAPSGVCVAPTATTPAGTDYSVSSTTDSTAYAQAYPYNYNYQNYYGWGGYGQQGYYQT